jgi:hypothetical protein
VYIDDIPTLRALGEKPIAINYEIALMRVLIWSDWLYGVMDRRCAKHDAFGSGAECGLAETGNGLGVAV